MNLEKLPPIALKCYLVINQNNSNLENFKNENTILT